MPTKSNNMSPMPMQPKIGEASLKFGPDWLRALSSSETQGNNANNTSPSPGGDAGGGGGRFGFSGWGNPVSFHSNSNNKDHNFSAASHFSSPPSFHQSHHQSAREMKGPPPPGHSNATRFKQSEHHYSREEMLALYDKNLEAPSFLLNFGTLYIDKMQPPLAFSQPSEDEIRIWHIPQPESSRQGPGAAPIGRGYAARGRGGGIDRGRGRGRGGYYGRPHEEEDRSSFSRPRNFERSQSNHERTSWGERNGVVGPGPVGPEENNRGGGNWRSRESFGGSARRQEENEDGWRKPRWRRDEEEEYRPNSSRRLHRSWSEDENHENIPEWARDNPSEESGTFDSTGAFHGEDRSNKSRETDRKLDSSDSMKSRIESEPSGSHSDRVQKRVQDRTDSVKPVIPASVKEETEAAGEEDDYMPTSMNRRSDPFPTSTHPYQQANSIMHIQKNDSDLQHHHLNDENRVLDARHQQQQHHLHKQHIQTVQHQITSPQEARAQLMHSQSIMSERNVSSNSVMQQQAHGDIRASNNLESKLPSVHNNSRNEEDHYRSMTEEAMNLVSKLIEEDGSGSRRGSPASGKLQGPRQGGIMPHPQQQHGDPMNINELSRSSSVSHPPQNIPSTVHPPAVSPASMDVWFYRDPQGSVQGPFSGQEMGLWYSQGYFLGSLLLRRECDKVFITLLEMGKLYGGNPLFSVTDSPPPPIQDPTSALDFPRGDSSQLQAQLHQQRQHQLLQQNMLREQYMLNMSHGGGIRKEESGWMGGPNIPQAPQQTRSVPNAPSSLTSEQIQAQLLMSMAKSQGLDRDPNAIDQLQALFQRQLKNSNSDGMMPQPQSQKGSYPDMMHRQGAPTMDVPKSPTPVTDPIQSLVQQLTSMANTQQQKNSASTKSDVISPWGQPTPVNAVQSQAPNQWGTSHPNAAPWEYREQMAKLQQEEELRRRKEEEDAERKRLEEEERNRIDEQQRQERDRKRIEEQQRLDEEKQRKIREEQYLHQKQQQELIRKQEEAEIQRQKELQRQQLEQQRQLRDEQTRLAEEQQRLEQQRLEKDRKEKEQADRDLKLRQERERERQEQLKMQQFSWNATAQPPAPTTGGKSILEIQHEEAIKEEKEASLKKKQREEQLRVQQQQQAQQQKAIGLKWAQSTAAPVKAPIKSLTEIQAEEQAKLQKQQDQEREKRAIINQHQQQQAAWSAQLTWANRASTLAASGGGGGSGGSKKVNGGVWEESSMASKLKASNNTSPSSNNRSQSSGEKKTKEMTEDSFMKLFSVQDSEGGGPGKSSRPKMQGMGGGSNDEFTRWCSDRIQAIASGSVDIPTFVSFLKEVESPYEVGDYVRSYLGDGKEAKEFSREFLERRSRWKNACKTGGGSIEDNLCRPASAVNPNSNDFQEVKAKGKKTKKGKMQKVDSRILGFSTSAAADRLNRDYGDSTD